MSAFGRIVHLTIAFLLLAATAPPPLFGQAPNAVDPDNLLGTYRGLGLPIPPDNAPLAQFQHGEANGTGKLEPVYVLGFVLKPAKDKQPAVLLIGTQECSVSEMLFAVDPGHVDIRRIWPEWEENRAGLATAIQCRARGWNELADNLQIKALEHDIGRGIRPYPPPVTPAKVGLARLGWTYWTARITKPDTDRAEIARRLEMLLTFGPELQRPENAALVRSLKATLIPSTAKPGSIDAAIDQLIDDDQAGMFPLPIGEPDPKYMAVGMHGFEAVPALIAHLDDDRLTRSLSLEFLEPRGEIIRVNELVDNLLSEIAGDELADNWPNRQTRFIPKDIANKWWNSVRGQSEEAYFTHHVLPKNSGFPHQIMLQVLATRYPARLPEIFAAALETHGGIAMGPLVEALAGSSLPREQKRALLLRAADVKDLSRRIEALHQLKDVDETTFVNELVKTVNSLPKTPTGPYWLAPESHVPIEVVRTADPRAWQALLAAARRADVWLRMQYLECMESGCFPNAPQGEQRISFLGEFLNDTEVRIAHNADGHPETGGPYSGPYAGFMFPRLEVRDCAALQIAGILKLPDTPEQDLQWTPQQWSAFRARVTGAMAKR